jgi:hypothetical protein
MDGVIGMPVVNTFGLPMAERGISGGLISEVVLCDIELGITDTKLTYLQPWYPTGVVSLA